MDFKKRLGQIRERLYNATPGEWFVRYSPVDDNDCFVQASRLDPDDPCDIEILGDDDTLYPTRKADVIFVANSQQDIRFLLDHINETENLLREVHEMAHKGECFQCLPLWDNVRSIVGDPRIVGSGSKKEDGESDGQ